MKILIMKGAADLSKTIGLLSSFKVKERGPMKLLSSHGVSGLVSEWLCEGMLSISLMQDR